MLSAVIQFGRALSLLSERDIVSEIELVLPEPEARPGLGRRLLRRVARWLLSMLVLFGGVGGIHTGFGYCPEQHVWLQRADVINLVTAPYRVARVIEWRTHTETVWLGRRFLPVRVAVCRHCFMPLHGELLTPGRMAAMVDEPRG